MLENVVKLKIEYIKEGEDMKKNIIKLMTIVIIVIVVSLLYSIISYNVEAAANFDPNPYTKSINNSETRGTDQIANAGNIIIGLLRGAGTVLSVIVIAVIGIRYMLGSVEEKATYKQSMLPYLIGAILVFGITTVLPVIIAIANSI